MKSNLPNAARGKPQEIVTLKVGRSEATYYMHMHILCSESSVLKTALNSEFKEDKSKEIFLRGTDEEVFEIIMHWCYTRELPGPNSERRWQAQTQKDDDGDETEFTWDFFMSSAYVFAKTYNMPFLASGINCLFGERFTTWESKCPSIATICRLFDNMPEHSWLCELFVEKFMGHWKRDFASNADKKLFQFLPPDFIEQAFHKFAERRDTLELLV